MISLLDDWLADWLSDWSVGLVGLLSLCYVKVYYFNIITNTTASNTRNWSVKGSSPLFVCVLFQGSSQAPILFFGHKDTIYFFPYTSCMFESLTPPYWNTHSLSPSLTDTWRGNNLQLSIKIWQVPSWHGQDMLTCDFLVCIIPSELHPRRVWCWVGSQEALTVEVLTTVDMQEINCYGNYSRHYKLILSHMWLIEGIKF